MKVFVDLWKVGGDEIDGGYTTGSDDQPSTTCFEDSCAAGVEVPLWTRDQVIDWLTLIGFNELVDRFRDRGVDGDLLLILTETNVRMSIGIESSLDLQRFMREVHKLKRSADYSSKDNTDLRSFLESIDPEFSVYTYPMLRAGVDRNCLRSLSEDQLSRECGITNSIHRHKILKTIKCVDVQLFAERPLLNPNSEEGLDGFISYRRSNGSYFASLLHFKLSQLGYSIFLDTESLGPGKFDNNLKRNIQQAKNFLLVLSPNSLDRCIGDSDFHDWVHKEVVTAIEYNCNVIPIMDNFQWPDVETLPEDMRVIVKYKSVTWEHECEDECVDKLVRLMWDETNGARFEGRSSSWSQGRSGVEKQTFTKSYRSAPCSPSIERKKRRDPRDFVMPGSNSGSDPSPWIGRRTDIDGSILCADVKGQLSIRAQEWKIQKARVEETKLMIESLLEFLQNPVPSTKYNSEHQKEDEKRVSQTISQITSSDLKAKPLTSVTVIRLMNVKNTRLLDETKSKVESLLKSLENPVSSTKHNSKLQEEDEKIVSQTISQITSSALEVEPSLSVAAESRLVNVKNTRALEKTISMIGNLLESLRNPGPSTKLNLEHRKEDKKRVPNNISQITSSALEAEPLTSVAESRLFNVNYTKVLEKTKLRVENLLESLKNTVSS